MTSSMVAKRKSVAELEVEWNQWVLSLHPWERHWLFGQGRELVWHDDFVYERVTDLDTLSMIVASHFEHLIKV